MRQKVKEHRQHMTKIRSGPKQKSLWLWNYPTTKILEMTDNRARENEHWYSRSTAPLHQIISSLGLSLLVSVHNYETFDITSGGKHGLSLQKARR